MPILTFVRQYIDHMPYSYFDYGLPYTKVISTVLFFYHITRELIFFFKKRMLGFIDLFVLRPMGSGRAE